MIFATKVGPFETAQCHSVMYLAVDDLGFLHAPVAARDNIAALRQLAAMTQTTAVCCDKKLKTAAEQLGYAVVATPAWAAQALGSVLLAMGLSGRIEEPPNYDLLAAFARASAAFAEARPWEHIDSDDTHEATLSDRVFDMNVMGSVGQEYGLILYPERGASSRINRLCLEGRTEEARRMASFVSMALDEAPSYAISELHRAFGLSYLPTPMKIRNGKHVLTTTEDLLHLTAVLDAVSRLSPGGRFASGAVAAGPFAATAEVRIVEPDRE